MSFQIETAWVNQFRSNIEVQFQQMGSRLRPTVRVETQNSEFEFFDRVTPTAAVKRTTRHSDTPIISTGHDRRRNGLDDYEWGDMIDDQDKVRLIADPTSAYVQNAVAALGRSMDSAVITGFNATAYTGKTGATAVTYPAASQVAVNYVESGAAANSNLTIGKLRRTRFLLTSAEAIADNELVTFVYTASQEQSLLRTTEVTNADYNAVKALVDGKVDTFMGFKFVRTELLGKTGNDRRCYAYPKSGMLLGVGSDITVRVGERADKSFNVQLYAKATFGSTRMWEEKVIEIACDETA